MVDYDLLKKKDEIRNKALKKISFKIRTEEEITKYLKDLGYSSELIIDTINFLKEYKYIDDVFYSKAYYKDAKLKKKGKLRIIKELKLKGVKEEDILKGIELLISEEGDNFKSELEDATSIKDKMIEELISSNKEIDDKFKAKVFRRLVSKGYSNDVCFKVIKDIK